MKTCPKCGTVLPDSIRGCGCGMDLSDVRSGTLDSGRDRKLIVERRVLVGVAIALVVSFLLQLIGRDGERPSRRVVMMDFALMGLLLVSLFALGARVRAGIPRSSAGRGKWTLLIAIGTLAAVGEIAIRWPRQSPSVVAIERALATPPALPAPPAPVSGSQSAPAPSEAPVRTFQPDKILLTTRMKGIRYQHERQSAAMNGSPWAVANASGEIEQRRALTPADLQDFRDKLGAVVASLDEGLEVFDQAKAKNVDLAEVFDGSPEADPSFWRAYRDFLRVSGKYHALLAGNWAEYRKKGVRPEEGESTPWQKQAQALGDEMDAAVARMKSDFGPKK